jgi:hypothetical protein
MAISSFLTKTATVKRLTADPTNTKKRTYQTQAGTVSVAVQPVDMSTDTMGAGISGKRYAIYAASGADIKQTDRLTISGDVYLLEEIQGWSQGGVTFVKAVAVRKG